MIESITVLDEKKLYELAEGVHYKKGGGGWLC